MKLTNEVHDTDRIEIPVFVNGSFAEKLQLTGKELKRLIVLLQEPEDHSSITVPIIDVQVDKKGNIKLDSSAGTAEYNPDDPNITLTNNPGDVPPTPTVGDDAKELRKDPEQKVGDEATDRRGD